MKQYVISKPDLIHNIRTIRSMAGDSQLIAVLKGQGYGLGLIEFATVLREEGVDFFAVSEVEEAVSLRNAGFDNDILLLTATTLEEELRAVLTHNIIAAAGSEHGIYTINRLAQELDMTARVHIKLDTGFGRFGFTPEQLSQVIETVSACENIQTEGVFSHLAFSFSDKRKDVEAPFTRFVSCVETLRSAGISLPLAHICNSCAFLQYPDMHLDAVRVGSALLGRLPLTRNYGLKRIGSLRSSVIEVKTLPKGHFVGYANTYKTKRETTIAIVPVGYKDGYGVEKSRDTFRLMDVLRYCYHDVRAFGSRLSVTVCGKRVPVIGRVSMYNVVLDVTGLDVKPGDEVILPANPILVSREIERIYLEQ
ncbi:MAG: alanine racemase [Ruminococcaceae bacterium]|nr:alanine racemase [Oscillospiraceae bacterium]